VEISCQKAWIGVRAGKPAPPLAASPAGSPPNSPSSPQPPARRHVRQRGRERRRRGREAGEGGEAGLLEIWGGQRIGRRQRDLEGKHDLEDWAVSARGTAILSS
jgi:hypothetical protein